jgi:DNA-dependent RNA polymerase auxiliary subunit epsilon
LYARNGAYVADRLTIGTVTLIAGTAGSVEEPQSESQSEITYILPQLPADVQDITNYALSLDNNNNDNIMVWKRLYQNTDELPQGTNNLYYNDAQVDARVEAKFHEKFNPYFDIRFIDKMPSITLDRVTNGINNQMIINGKYQGDLFVSGRLNVNHLIVNKIEVLGYGGNSDVLSSSTSGLSALGTAITDLTTIITNTSNQLVNALNTLTNRVATLESRL